MPVKNTQLIRLQDVMQLKGGENSHLEASLFAAVDAGDHYLGNCVYSPEFDVGLKTRVPGWTNIGDISACLRTTVGLGEIYSGTETPYIAMSAKHTRPVAIANGRTQLEALRKALAGDLNSPFGGFFGFNKSMDTETAEFLGRDDMFYEGVVAPDYESGVVETLTTKRKSDGRRLLVRTGILTPDDLDVFGCSLQPVAMGYFLRQTMEPVFDARKEAVVVTNNNGASNINTLDDRMIADINFAGNAAIYLVSNLVFFVNNGAVAGLGDGCGARTVAAEKARGMLEISAYAALSRARHGFPDSDELWETVLYDTPFSKQDFSDLPTPLRLVGFSDAFYPKLDGFIETAGIDRINSNFQQRRVNYVEREKGVDVTKTFIPKRKKFDPNYDMALIPEVIVQPGGSLGDKLVIPVAEKHNMKMVFTMTPEQYEKYKAGEKGITGRRFFGHIIMS